MFKQYKISDLIKELRQQKSEHGDLPVSLSSDEEGNSFQPVGDCINDNPDGSKSRCIPFSAEDGVLTIWPTSI